MNKEKIFRKVWQDPLYFLSFGFGSGLIPVAPGTWGTLAAIPIYALLVGMHWSLYLVFTLLALAGGIWMTASVSQDLGEHDYSGIVWDEIVGYLITMFLAPPSWIWMIIGFILFRIFDIWKPWPISFIDKKVTGGLGIMLDDVLASIPAWLILQFLAWSFMR